MPQSKNTVNEIKASLLDFHKKMGYTIFESFPLISDDSTVLFTNAAITPFKEFFADPFISPLNYALIQKCVRVGGASELEKIGINAHCLTFFEMFGSGLFTNNAEQAVAYLLQLLNSIGITQERLYFTIPIEGDFDAALARNGIPKSRIFLLTDNGAFWQKWQFGDPGLIGHGLTTIVSRVAQKARSIEQLIAQPEEFIELLNLIYIHAQTLADGSISSIPHPGFDLGVGIERLSAVLQGVNSYEIDTVEPLVQVTSKFLSSKVRISNKATTRICADHLRTIAMLLGEGLMPSNKKQGYVLRKLIRRFLETIWISVGHIVTTEPLIIDFISILRSQGNETIIASNVIQSIREEESALKAVIQKSKSVLYKQPEISLHKLRDTYGLPSSLISLVIDEKQKGNG